MPESVTLSQQESHLDSIRRTDALLPGPRAKSCRMFRLTFFVIFLKLSQYDYGLTLTLEEHRSGKPPIETYCERQQQRSSQEV